MKIHLEGMGVTGSLIAWKLAQRGMDFTWHDTDEHVTAWKACTGAIYPGGKPGSLDELTYERWLDWYEEMWDEKAFEVADFVYNHKKPPHEGNYTQREWKGGADLRVAWTRSLHFNAQMFVTDMRQRFAGKRISHEPYSRPIDRYIVTHGFGGRNTHAYWGWTRLVQLKYKVEAEARQAFYCRQGRLFMSYAYPVPGTPWWYAGSNLYKQQRGKYHALDMEPKYESWKKHFLEMTGGAVEIVKEGEFLEGWRPARTDPDWVQMAEGGAIGPNHNREMVLRCPPLWNSGVRHFPHVWGELTTYLGITGERLDVKSIPERN